MYIENLNNDGWYGILSCMEVLPMKSEEYKKLFRGLKYYIMDEQKVFADVNERIDKLVSNSDNPEKAIKALICKLDGTTNISDGSTSITLAYSLLIGVFTLMSIITSGNGVDWYKNAVLFLITLILAACFILLVMGLISNIKGRKCEFVLYALKFRYEELKQNKSASDENKGKEINKPIYNEDEKTYIVKVIKK